MSEIKRSDRGVIAEKAVLVGVILPGQDHGGSRYDPLAELAALAEAAGAVIAGRVVQRRDRPSAGTYVGKGKVEEIVAAIETKGANLVIFDNELSPSQIRELEEQCKRRVIDRTELILDIFATRARTAAARLQVELAQLEYTAPRLRGMWTHLERIAGGVGTAAGGVGGIGTRGPGETQIEIDRRIVQKRVSFLKKQIAEIDRRKIREVRARGDHFTVSLVGYTNAGKSTLLRALTGSEAFVADQLFATLDTKTRRWNLGGGQTALLSDTVGFVRNLPHDLVASFRATLEEAIHSDLLLHVVDASSHDGAGQVRAVEAVLKELECDEIPTIRVLNKVDAVGHDSALPELRARWPEAVEISAKNGMGVDRLTERVIEQMRIKFVRVRVETASSNGKLISYVSRHGHIVGQDFSDGQLVLDLRLPRGEVPRVVGLGGRIVWEEGLEVGPSESGSVAAGG